MAQSGSHVDVEVSSRSSARGEAAHDGEEHEISATTQQVDAGSAEDATGGIKKPRAPVRGEVWPSQAVPSSTAEGLLARWRQRAGLTTSDTTHSVTLSHSEVENAVTSAFAEMPASTAQSWGNWYVNDPNSRRVFAALCSRVGPGSDDTIRGVLTGLVEDKDPWVRWKALRCLLYMGNEDCDLVRRYWMGEPDRILRNIVVEAAQQLPGEGCLALLSEIARADDSDSIRSSAFKKLIEAGGEDHPQYLVPAVEACLNDQSEFIRAEALLEAARIDVDYALNFARRNLSRSVSNAEAVSSAQVLSEHGNLGELAGLADAFSRKRFNDYVFSGAVRRFVERFGATVVQGCISQFKDNLSRETASKVTAQ
jgi:hypothetical protein